MDESKQRVTPERLTTKPKPSPPTPLAEGEIIFSNKHYDVVVKGFANGRMPTGYPTNGYYALVSKTSGVEEHGCLSMGEAVLQATLSSSQLSAIELQGAEQAVNPVALTAGIGLPRFLGRIVVIAVLSLEG